MIRVLVAEDSVTTRELLVAILTSDPEIQVVGQAKNGIEAVDLTRELRPDVVTMDIQMPRMSGFEATKRIMIEAPTPIVIVSASVDVRQVEVSMNALRVGAVALLPKPNGPGSPDFDGAARQFVTTVKSMSQVKVVRHWREHTRTAAPVAASVSSQQRTPQIVAIGASTGGPAALHRLLGELPGDMAAPVMVVQHIADGFVDGLATWLNGSCALHVKVAVDGEPLMPGVVYLAPDDRHLALSGRARVALSEAPPEGGFRPSASILFESVARQFGGSAVAVILTGMGRDGVDGLRAVRAAGGTVIAQDERTSVVFGMPAAAVEANVVDRVLPLPLIPTHLMELFRRESPRS